jgi:hypothetical protein
MLLVVFASFVIRIGAEILSGSATGSASGSGLGSASGSGLGSGSGSGYDSEDDNDGILPAVRDLYVKCFRMQPSKRRILIQSPESQCLITWQYPDTEDHIQFVVESQENRSASWIATWPSNKDTLISFDSLKGKARIRVWAQLQSDVNVTSAVVMQEINLQRAVRMGARRPALFRPELVPPPTDYGDDGSDDSDGTPGRAATIAIAVGSTAVSIPFLMSVLLGLKYLLCGSISDMRLRVMRKMIERWPKEDPNRQEQEREVQLSVSQV